MGAYPHPRRTGYDTPLLRLPPLLPHGLLPAGAALPRAGSLPAPGEALGEAGNSRKKSFRNNSMLPGKPWLSAIGLLFLMPPNFHKQSLFFFFFFFSPILGVSAEAPRSDAKRGAAPSQPEPGLKHSAILNFSWKTSHFKWGTHLKAANPEVSIPLVGDIEGKWNSPQKIVHKASTYVTTTTKGIARNPTFKPGQGN